MKLYPPLLTHDLPYTLITSLQLVTSPTHPIPPQIRQFRIDFQKEIVSQSEAHLVSIMVEGGIGKPLKINSDFVLGTGSLRGKTLLTLKLNHEA